MKRLIAALMMVAAVAYSAEIVVEWDAPTANTDGSPIESSLTYEVLAGSSDGVYDRTNTVSGTSINLSVPKNRWQYVAVVAVNEVGERSDLSESLKCALKVAPGRPTRVRAK